MKKEVIDRMLTYTFEESGRILDSTGHEVTDEEDVIALRATKLVYDMTMKEVKNGAKYEDILQANINFFNALHYNPGNTSSNLVQQILSGGNHAEVTFDTDAFSKENLQELITNSNSQEALFMPENLENTKALIELKLREKNLSLDSFETDLILLGNNQGKLTVDYKIKDLTEQTSLEETEIQETPVSSNVIEEEQRLVRELDFQRRNYEKIKQQYQKDNKEVDSIIRDQFETTIANLENQIAALHPEEPKIEAESNEINDVANSPITKEEAEALLDEAMKESAINNQAEEISNPLDNMLTQEEINALLNGVDEDLENKETQDEEIKSSLSEEDIDKMVNENQEKMISDLIGRRGSLERELTYDKELDSSRRERYQREIDSINTQLADLGYSENQNNQKSDQNDLNEDTQQDDFDNELYEEMKKIVSKERIFYFQVDIPYVCQGASSEFLKSVRDKRDEFEVSVNNIEEKINKAKKVGNRKVLNQLEMEDFNLRKNIIEYAALLPIRMRGGLVNNSIDETIQLYKNNSSSMVIESFNFAREHSEMFEFISNLENNDKEKDDNQNTSDNKDSSASNKLKSEDLYPNEEPMLNGIFTYQEFDDILNKYKYDKGVVTSKVNSEEITDEDIILKTKAAYLIEALIKEEIKEKTGEVEPVVLPENIVNHYLRVFSDQIIENNDINNILNAIVQSNGHYEYETDEIVRTNDTLENDIKNQVKSALQSPLVLFVEPIRDMTEAIITLIQRKKGLFVDNIKTLLQDNAGKVKLTVDYSFKRQVKPQPLLDIMSVEDVRFYIENFNIINVQENFSMIFSKEKMEYIEDEKIIEKVRIAYLIYKYAGLYSTNKTITDEDIQKSIASFSMYESNEEISSLLRSLIIDPIVSGKFDSITKEYTSLDEAFTLFNEENLENTKALLKILCRQRRLELTALNVGFDKTETGQTLLKINLKINDPTKQKNENDEKNEKYTFQRKLFLVNKIKEYQKQYQYTSEYGLVGRFNTEEEIDEETYLRVMSAKFVWNEARQMAGNREEFKNNLDEYLNLGYESILKSNIINQIITTPNHIEYEIDENDVQADYFYNSEKYPFVEAYLRMQFRLSDLDIEITNVEPRRENGKIIMNIDYEVYNLTDDFENEEENVAEENTNTILPSMAVAILDVFVKEGLDYYSSQTTSNDLKRAYLNDRIGRSKTIDERFYFQIRLKAMDYIASYQKLTELEKIRVEALSTNNEIGLKYANQELEKFYNTVVINLNISDEEINILAENERNAFFSLKEEMENLMERNEFFVAEDDIEEQESWDDSSNSSSAYEQNGTSIPNSLNAEALGYIIREIDILKESLFKEKITYIDLLTFINETLPNLIELSNSANIFDLSQKLRNISNLMGTTIINSIKNVGYRVDKNSIKNAIEIEDLNIYDFIKKINRKYVVLNGTDYNELKDILDTSLYQVYQVTKDILNDLKPKEKKSLGKKIKGFFMFDEEKLREFEEASREDSLRR